MSVAVQLPTAAAGALSETAVQRLRVDLWQVDGRWVAGWSLMWVEPDGDYAAAIDQHDVGAFFLVSTASTPRAAILAGDLPVPQTWKTHVANTDYLDALAEDWNDRVRRSRLSDH